MSCNVGGGALGEVQGSYHHGCGPERVTGAFEVMPLDAVQFPDVLSVREVHAVQVGRTTGVEPPTCKDNNPESGKWLIFV